MQRKRTGTTIIIALAALGVLAGGCWTVAARGEIPFLSFESLASGINEEAAAQAAMVSQRRRQASCFAQQMAACHAERNLKGPCPLGKLSSR